MAKLDPDHVRWCRDLFRELSDGASWGIPRSGMLFTRQGAELVLTSQAPWTSRIRGTAADWKDAQDEEFKNTREHFAAAGITVRHGIN